ncbi:S-adenosylmethionine synthetase [Methanocella sp. CWC-04]|uniref:S-adenosylmethionine synthetase n=1 Tax=Methanooceanicella nereidis TaxID=2052831 RepID=A0AAP2RAY7_9EURY|nr:S-adenosylmethionine synthetase [Methanocella sp. CWC-04]
MIIEKLPIPYSEHRFEIVEKKGLGHPDSLCDGISDAVSRGLCKYYMDHFGHILHHNVDKVLISAGRSETGFGGGEILKLMSIIIGGRATDRFQGQNIPVYEIARECTEKYMKSTLKNIDNYFEVEPRLGMGASELKSLAEKVTANDTSIGVGFAPLSRLETDVHKAEVIMRTVTGVGEDVKVMGLRTNDDLLLTLSAAIVSKYATGMDEYESIKSRVRQKVTDSLSSGWEGLSVTVNAADTNKNIYLTKTGTSAEMGDDGETGRGNRANGLITPGRPMTLEAHAGKNPRNHVGKIYNLIAIRAADDLVRQCGVEEAYVYLVSKIGAPLDKPQLKAARIYGDAAPDKIEYVIDYWLEMIPGVMEDFLAGKC